MVWNGIFLRNLCGGILKAVRYPYQSHDRQVKSCAGATSDNVMLILLCLIS